MKAVFSSLFLAIPTISQAALPGGITFPETELAPALQIMALLTILSLAPGILMMLSSFTRIVIVLSMLRTALGLQQTPPNTVLISLALFLTFFSMAPIGKTIYSQAIVPFQQKKLPADEALYIASQPLKTFMLRQTREKDMQLMLDLAKSPLPNSAEALEWVHLIPAFLLSELQTAFQIGFMLFLPFLLVDLIVSGILMTMGMMMVPPMSISLPIKILLFVLIDGWNLVIQSLMTSFH
ncbi:MAG: flagellar type III secretion system pore protein FliP [Legionellaceae bacterium]|nr:flagellar type III secretion system pore protein FliP [Legionellaceae bacterium]